MLKKFIFTLFISFLLVFESTAKDTFLSLKNDKVNYRPISLLPTLSKICESVIHHRLLSHCLENNVISERQGAYIKGDSTVKFFRLNFNLFSKSLTIKSLFVLIVFLSFSSSK